MRDGAVACTVQGMNAEQALAKARGREVIAVEDMVRGSDHVTVRFADGTSLVLRHQPDCCESVDLEDVVGDPDDLIGHRLTMAEEVSSEGAPDPEYAESHTWTFYKLGGLGGYVTMRWLGQSNGYYSERVCVEFDGSAS